MKKIKIIQDSSCESDSDDSKSSYSSSKKFAKLMKPAVSLDSSSGSDSDSEKSDSEYKKLPNSKTNNISKTKPTAPVSDSENSDCESPKEEKEEEEEEDRVPLSDLEKKFQFIIAQKVSPKLSYRQMAIQLIGLQNDLSIGAYSGVAFDTLSQQISDHINSFLTKCDICGVQCKNSSSLGNHLISKHNNVPHRVIDKLKYDVEIDEYKSGKKLTGDKELDDKIKKLYEKKTNGKNKRGKYLDKTICYFVTIKPKNCTVDSLKKIIEFIKTNSVANSPKLLYYVFEQRGETEKNMGTGGHIHCLVSNTCKPSLVKRCIFRASSKINKTEKCVGDESCIHVVSVESSSHLNNAINYMNGEKKPEKKQKCEINKIWRKSNNLMDFYNLDLDNTIIPKAVNNVTFEKSECCIERSGDEKFCNVVVDGVKYRVKLC